MCTIFGSFFAKIENRDFWPPDLPVEILAKKFLLFLDEKKIFCFGQISLRIAPNGLLVYNIDYLVLNKNVMKHIEKFLARNKRKF